MNRIIPIDIYKRGVLVSFGTKEDLFKFIKRRCPDYMDDAKEIVDSEPYLAITGSVGADALIYSPEVPKLTVAVHEVCHAAMMILEKVGIKPDDGSGEPYAYLVEYILDKMMDLFSDELSDVRSPSCSGASSRSSP